MRVNAKQLVLATALLVVVVVGLAQSTAATQMPGTPIVLNDSLTVPLDNHNVELVGQIGGASYAVAVQGNYAYLGIGPRLTILDMANPTWPQLAGQTAPLPGLVQDVVVAGSYAYVAAFDAGLRVINIANPANPVEVGAFNTPGSARGVAVAGSYAFVAAEYAGLRVINIANPANPVEVSAFSTTGYLADVAVAGSYAYLADEDAGLRVINIANPANPVEVGAFSTPGWARDVAVAGSYAFVADVGTGLRVINIANPTNPVEVGAFDTPGNAFGVAVAGSHAFVAASDAGLRVINIANPTNPVEVSAFDKPGNAVGVAVAGSYAYVAASDAGLRVINIANHTSPVEVGAFNTPGSARDVAVAGSYAYVADGFAGLRVINIVNPANPVEAGAFNTPGWARDVAVAGSYAFVAAEDVGLRVINIANPANPVEVGAFNTPGSARGVAVAGSYAFVADDYAGLRVINIANPANPVEVSAFSTTGPVWRVAVAGSYAYVADLYAGLRVINIANPANPVEVGAFDTPGSTDAYVAGTYAYVSYAYFDENWSGMRVINIANPASPVEVGVFDTPGGALDLAVADAFVFVADADGGLAILRYTSDDPTATPTWTPTSTPTPSPTPTATPTQIWTPTPTPTPTWTATPTPTPTNTPTPTPTATTVPPSSGDPYEPDNTCAQARPIVTDGTAQEHTFHAQADADWVRFDATAGRRYLIEAHPPPGSPADMAVEFYNSCSGPPAGSQGYTFSPNVRLEFEAAATGPIYLKLVNHQPEIFGPQVSYRLSVLALTQEPQPGALILVAGRNSSNDPLQANIHQVTDAVYALFRNHGYDDNRIFYLATENRPGRDGLPTVANLQAAITAWAVDKVGPDRALTLYLMDHGTHELIYLDKPSYQWVAPHQLHQWLSQLEAARPGVRINVIVEACNSGGFIDAPQTASGPGRVVITSTSPDKLAWASTSGAVFSDHFLDTLGQGASLFSAFQSAAWAVQTTGNPQQPWLDGNGNGISNEPADEAEAARRGFAYAGTLVDDRWPPYIAQADPIQIGADGRGRLRVEVRDDVRAQRVWALIYPPSYQPPEEQEDLVWENVTSVNLFREGVSDWFSTTYPGFDQRGRYRVVFNAEDGEGLSARPLTVQADNGGVYLPLIVR